MTRLLIDTVGWAGAAALLLAYGLVSSGRLNGRSIRFQLLNLGGAVGLLANGIYHDAWPSAALNAVWFVIGVTALMRISRTPTSQSGRSSSSP
jgi:hypothetical protein